MEKYYIIPHSLTPVFEIEANSPEEAMEEFAIQMDLDMNAYFKAVDAYGINSVELNESKRQYINWAMEVLSDDFEVEDEDVARDAAEWAWDKYTDGDGYTEYECIEMAVDEFDLWSEDEDEDEDDEDEEDW